MQRTKLAAALALMFIGSPAQAQELTFSMEIGSASLGSPGHDGTALRAGSVLAPEFDPPALGPLNLPGTQRFVALLGLAPGMNEVDAMSHGRDARPNSGILPGQLVFSVDRLSTGMGGFPWASVQSELPESASDAFVNVVAVGAVPADHTILNPNVAILDGNGLAHPGTGYMRGGFGIDETGDAIDGIDQLVGAGGSLGQLFFSLDPSTALAHGQLPGNVLITAFSGTFGMYTSAPSLGLDLVQGPGSDDIDALAVWDDGDGFYEPPSTVNNPNDPYLWGPGFGDMILFSVTRDSALIGQPDSHFGLPIQAGDVLTYPEPFGGSPYPAIVLAAERIALVTDRGSNLVMDDLNALDLTFKPLFDCNLNGVEDAVDITMAGGSDLNLNGYLDSCEGVVNYCTAGTSAWGCQATLSAAGYASATASSGFSVTANNMNGGVNGLFFFSTSGRIALPWGSSTSLRCVGSPSKRTSLQSASGSTGGCGSMSRDLNASWCPTCPKPAQNPGVGAVVQLQAWYRDPMAAGVTNTAMSDAIEFTILP